MCHVCTCMFLRLMLSVFPTTLHLTLWARVFYWTWKSRFNYTNWAAARLSLQCCPLHSDPRDPNTGLHACRASTLHTDALTTQGPSLLFSNHLLFSFHSMEWDAKIHKLMPHHVLERIRQHSSWAWRAGMWKTQCSVSWEKAGWEERMEGGKAEEKK